MSLWPKNDSKDLEWKFPKVHVKISWKFACKSEIAFWCTFDQKILKTFEYFKVWIISKLQKLKVILWPKSDCKDLEWTFPKSTC